MEVSLNHNAACSDIHNMCFRIHTNVPRTLTLVVIPSSSQIPVSSTLNTEEDQDAGLEHLRYLRCHLTRLGGTILDRRDAFIQRLGICPDSIKSTQHHQGFGRRLEEALDDLENDEDVRRLRECWRFDEDDDPLVPRNKIASC
jgi:enhancer of polycomb-like protein